MPSGSVAKHDGDSAGSARSGAVTERLVDRSDSLISEPAGVSMVPIRSGPLRQPLDSGLLTMCARPPPYAWTSVLSYFVNSSNTRGHQPACTDHAKKV
jgi:hypothetical protein